MGSKIYTLGGETKETEEDLKNKERALKEREEKQREANLVLQNKEGNLSEVQKYNKSLFELDERLVNLKLPKGRVLIRFFRQSKETASGLYVPTTESYISEHSGKLKLAKVDGEVKYTTRGVVVAVGPECSSDLAPGTVIDVYMQTYNNIMQYWSPLDRDNMSVKNPENYFTVPENYINFIWTTYQL